VLIRNEIEASSLEHEVLTLLLSQLNHFVISLLLAKLYGGGAAAAGSLLYLASSFARSFRMGLVLLAFM